MVNSLRIVLAIHVTHDATEDERHAALVKVRFAAYEVQAFFRREVTSDTKVLGILTLPDPLDSSGLPPRPRSRGGDYDLPEMKRAYDALPEKFSEPVTNWHVWAGYESNICGRAEKPGYVGITYKYCDWHTMCHELGHNLGLGHDNKRRLTADGYVTEQYGGEGLMANYQRLKPVRIGGPHSAYLGLVEPVEITESRNVLLAPMRLPEYGRHANEIPLARVGNMHIYSYDGITVYCSELLASKAAVQYARLDNPGDIAPLLEGLAVEYLGSRNNTVMVGIVMDSNAPVDVSWPETILPEVA